MLDGWEVCLCVITPPPFQTPQVGVQFRRMRLSRLRATRAKSGDQLKYTPLKYPTQFCYYTNGSFKPPKQNKQWTMETGKSWIWYSQPFQEPKNCIKITGTTKYPTSRNDGHTPHSTTPYHNVPKWANPHIHRLPKHPIPPKHPNQTPH